MTQDAFKPRIVLLCHDDDPIDARGIASWLANRFDLAGIVRLKERPGRLFLKIRREIRRSGWSGLVDVAAFRLYYRLKLARRDQEWMRAEAEWLQARYPADLERVPALVSADPNGEDVRCFLRQLVPDLMLARCKFILKPEVYTQPRHGTYVLHPGICPEYRNAHGCFWALVNRDLGRVGMTLLRVDTGVDTGPILLQASYPFDERRESPFVVQYRVVLENLEAIAAALKNACTTPSPVLPVAGRRSAAWGQPRLSAYWRWQHSLDGTPQPCKDS